MDPETKKIIQEQFRKLPKNLQDAILAADLPEKFRTVMTKHALRLDQAADVENETMLVMLGLEHPDEYTENIVREAELPEAKAKEIADDINRMIFLPIRASLRGLHESEAAGETEEEAPKEMTREERAVVTPPATPSSAFSSSAAPLPRPAVPPREAPQEPTGPDIFRQKLGGTMRMPREHVPLTLAKPAGTGSVEAPPARPSGDPYREAVSEKETAAFKSTPKAAAQGAPQNLPGAFVNAAQQRPDAPLSGAPAASPLSSAPRPEERMGVPPPRFGAATPPFAAAARKEMPVTPKQPERPQGEAPQKAPPQPIIIGRMPRK